MTFCGLGEGDSMGFITSEAANAFADGFLSRPIAVVRFLDMGQWLSLGARTLLIPQDCRRLFYLPLRLIKQHWATSPL